MFGNFGNLSTADPARLKRLLVELKHSVTTQESVYIFPILDNLPEYLDLTFDHIYSFGRAENVQLHDPGRDPYGFEQQERSRQNTDHVIELLSTKEYGLLNILIEAAQKYSTKYMYRLHIKYFPKHTQSFLMSNQRNNYCAQFFELMQFKEKSKAYSGSDLYIVCAPDEYFMFMLLFAFSEYGYKIDYDSKDGVRQTVLGQVANQAIKDMLNYLVDLTHSTSGHKMFRNKLLLFGEDYSIVPTILQIHSNPSIQIPFDVAKNNSNLSRIAAMQLAATLVMIQQRMSRKNSRSKRQISSKSASHFEDQLFPFCSRIHDYCFVELTGTRRESNSRLGDIGEVILRLINPEGMLFSQGVLIQEHEEQIGSKEHKQYEFSQFQQDHENRMLQQHIKNYLKINSVIISHLFGLYIITLKEIMDKVTSHDVEVLLELLKYFEVKQDKMGTERQFYGSITVTEFESSIKASVSEFSSNLKRNYDLNIIHTRTSKALKDTALSAAAGLMQTNIPYARDAVQLLKNYFKLGPYLDRNEQLDHQANQYKNQEEIDLYNNRFLEKHRRLWSDPFRQDESVFLYYCLAIPVGWALDVKNYKIKSLPVPRETPRMRFQSNRAVEDQSSLKIWYPGTNTRYMAQSKSIYAIIFYLALGLILLFYFAIFRSRKNN